MDRLAERVRFYSDEHVSRAVVKGLRQRGVDVMTVAESRMLGAGDEEHLAFAQRESRVLFTQDDDFLRLHASGVEHAGLVYARQRTPVGEVIHGLMLVHEILTPDEMTGHLEYI